MSKDKAMSREYDISTQIVSRMWQQISHTQGILLTQIEAIFDDSVRAKAFKSLVKREINNMGNYIQDNIYEEWKVQARGVGRKPELPMSLLEDE
jgi:CRISPR/Cas system-associated endonuclease Cas1